MDRERSPAYAALTNGSRRVLAAIEKAVGDGDSAAIPHTDFRLHHGISRRVVSLSVKQLDALGFVEVSSGVRLVNCYRLSRRWSAITKAEAVRLSISARAPLPMRRFERRRDPVQPPPQPVRVIEPVETDGPVQFMERRPPSMPSLRWLEAR